MNDNDRRTFLSTEDVRAAGNPPVLGIRVNEPIAIATGPWDETGEGEPLMTRQRTVYVELDRDEIETLREQGQEAINAFARRIGHIASRALGGYVRRWDNE